MFGTGLADDLSLPRRAAWSLLGTPLGAPMRWNNSNLNRRDFAGRTLADLAVGRVPTPKDRCYAALRRGRLTWPDPSDLSGNDEVARALWNDSAELVGLPP